MSKKVLVEQLRQLESDGLVRRREHLTFPPEVSYGLTDTGGSLIPVLGIIDRWAAEHLSSRAVLTVARDAES